MARDSCICQSSLWCRIASYEELLNQHIYVVFFLPLLIASGGNTGSQSTTLVIRAMAVGDVTMRDWGKVFAKEALVSFALGITMAAAIAVIGYYRGSDYGAGTETAIIIALSMVIVCDVWWTIRCNYSFCL
ncbi:magnesium transporter [Ignatzschineria indica]|uniref:magnesium transporter n=1 Tax=Ignatzschineria indica TaxID=472583 RepID=UPI0036457A15